MSFWVVGCLPLWTFPSLSHLQHLIFSVFPVPRWRIWADITQGRGSRGQLCPSLLHPGCQSSLLSFSWSLHHSAVHLSAWLLCKLHPQSGSQNTQVGSVPLSKVQHDYAVASCIIQVSEIIMDVFLFQESGEKSGEAGKCHSGGQFIEKLSNTSWFYFTSNTGHPTCCLQNVKKTTYMYSTMRLNLYQSSNEN